jgi:hypothetical protein
MPYISAFRKRSVLRRCYLGLGTRWMTSNGICEPHERDAAHVRATPKATGCVVIHKPHRGPGCASLQPSRERVAIRHMRTRRRSVSAYHQAQTQEPLSRRDAVSGLWLYACACCPGETRDLGGLRRDQLAERLRVYGMSARPVPSNPKPAHSQKRPDSADDRRVEYCRILPCFLSDRAGSASKCGTVWPLLGT